MRYALDTNTVVAALNGVPAVTGRLASLLPDDIVIPAPVVAELYFGARASGRVLVTNDAALLDGTIPGLLAEDWLAGARPPNA